jgi:hypothetical protein
MYVRAGVDPVPTGRCAEHMSGEDLRQLVDAHLKSEGGDPAEPILHLRVWDALVAACLR